MSNTNTNTHSAWRSLGKGISYVASINNTGPGDKYSYTDKVDKALPMTEKQCRSFCAYMKQCSTVGFWS